MNIDTVCYKKTYLNSGKHEKNLALTIHADVPNILIILLDIWDIKTDI